MYSMLYTQHDVKRQYATWYATTHVVYTYVWVYVCMYSMLCTQHNAKCQYATWYATTYVIFMYVCKYGMLYTQQNLKRQYATWYATTHIVCMYMVCCVPTKFEECKRNLICNFTLISNYTCSMYVCMNVCIVCYIPNTM